MLDKIAPCGVQQIGSRDAPAHHSKEEDAEIGKVEPLRSKEVVTNHLRQFRNLGAETHELFPCYAVL